MAVAKQYWPTFLRKNGNSRVDEMTIVKCFEKGNLLRLVRFIKQAAREDLLSAILDRFMGDAVRVVFQPLVFCFGGNPFYYSR